MSRKGFFTEDLILESPPEGTVALCGKCKLYTSCKSPKMPVSGEGKKKILIVGEAPGENEDISGKQFVGKAGKRLSSALNNVGINMRKDCWITNAIICRPTTSNGSNRTPTHNEIRYCRPNLTQTIRELNPEVIIPLGQVAIESVIAPFWREKVGPVTKWVGWRIPCQEINTWICPTYHPSFVLRNDDTKGGKLLSKLFEDHLKAASQANCGARGLRPHDSGFISNYENKVKVILDDQEAASIIRKWTNISQPCTWDIETNMLKPESDLAQIVCASICWNGKETISFPWRGKVIPAMKRFLKSDTPKWGQNIKFEDRWAKKILKVRVKNWKYDGMLGKHWLDNRRGITGLKFQAFVHFGMCRYDEKIEQFLKAKTSNTRNRIKQVDMKKLLIYCGLDSLLEWKVCHLQKSIHTFRRLSNE